MDNLSKNCKKSEDFMSERIDNDCMKFDGLELGKKLNVSPFEYSQSCLSWPIATFTLIYAFSFNAFNLIFFGASIALLNGLSVLINGVATVYLLLRIVYKINKVNS